MNSESLCLANVEKTLGSKKILSDVSFSINENEIVGLLGPNGAGKTTAFYIAAGLVFPDQGKVFINSTDVTKDPMHVRSVKGLGYLPQEASIFSDLSVENNLRIKIDSYLIKGSDARLSHKGEKLEIFGKPATIKSSTIDGEAERFVIYPDKSMSLLGNAKLINQGNSITANLITYQITTNE